MELQDDNNIGREQYMLPWFVLSFFV